jgi:hypothetical protein
VKRRSEVHKSIKPGTDAPAGVIRRILISNVIARGQGSSLINGHPDRWLEDITFDNVRLYLTADPKAAYDRTTDALTFRQVKNLKLRNMQVSWGEPALAGWQSALRIQDVKGLVLEGFGGGPARGNSQTAAVVLDQVEDAVLRNCRATEGTGTFLRLSGGRTMPVVLHGNDFTRAQVPWVLGPEVPKGAVQER